MRSFEMLKEYLRGTGVRRAIASVLVAAECLSVVSVGLPAAYAEEGVPLAAVELTDRTTNTAPAAEVLESGQEETVTPSEAARLGEEAAMSFADEAERAAEEAEQAADETARILGEEFTGAVLEAARQSAGQAEDAAGRARDAAVRAADEADWAAQAVEIAAQEAARTADEAQKAAEEAESAARTAEEIAEAARMLEEAVMAAQERDRERSGSEQLQEAAEERAAKREEAKLNTIVATPIPTGELTAMPEKTGQQENTEDQKTDSEQPAEAEETPTGVTQEAAEAGAAAEVKAEEAARAREYATAMGEEYDRTYAAALNASEQANRAFAASDRAARAAARASTALAEAEERFAQMPGDEQADQPERPESAENTDAAETADAADQNDTAENNDAAENTDRTYNTESAVTVWGEVPDGVYVQVENVTERYQAFDPRAANALTAGEAGVSFGDGTAAEKSCRVLAAYDISLSLNGEEYQPEAGKPLTVNITDPAIEEGLELEVWHIHDSGATEQITDFTVEGGAVRFDVESFSVYLLCACTADSHTDDNTHTDAAEAAEQPAPIPQEEQADSSDNAVAVWGEVPAGVYVQTEDVSARYQDFVPSAANMLMSGETNAFLSDGSGAERSRHVLAAYDISLSLNGEEYQPEAGTPLTVSITNPAIQEGLELEVWHIHDDGAAEPITDFTVEGSTVRFAAESFSVYLVCAYTVDFHWGDYTYSIAGESEITLSALLEKLGVTEITVADVTEVAFSDPALVEVEAVKDEAEQTTDWLLKSLAPFNTDEVLTLILKNGLNVEIKVTDASTVTSGTWSNGTNGNGEWSLDNDGVLTLSGTGRMGDYGSAATTPWAQYRKTTEPFIRKLVVSGGITYIAKNLLARSTYLSEIDASRCTALSGTQGADLFKATAGGGEALITSAIHTVNFSGNTGLTGFGQNALRDVNNIQYLDISGTQFSNDTLSNTTEGFGASIAKIQTLKANNCAKLTGNLDLSSYTALTTLELSGCTELTSLTVPSGVTTLDISDCTGLDSLDLSACTALTTLKVGNRNDQTDLSWLTLPASVTTLDASGFTSLTTLGAVPASVTSLNVSGCTGLTALDLSGTSLTNIVVSENASLTTLKLPASVTRLNVDNCPNLVIYYDGKAEDLPAIPDSVSLITWGDYTYTIKKNGTATLEVILAACGITAITVSDVQSISVIDTSVLEVTDLTVKSLQNFTEPQTLTVTLTNGMSGSISIACETLEESDNLNLFLDDKTVYSYEGETHPISDPAIVEENDVLNLTLSFSEIPEEQEGERQMKLSAPMTYTFPAGLTVSAVPETVTFNIQSGEQTISVTADVTFNAETGVLTVTGNYGEQESAVSAATAVSFSIPVSVQVSTVPQDYELGNGLKLSAVKAHNVKVFSFDAGDYIVDQETGIITVTYTAVVEAENDLDFDEYVYPVSIKDSAAGADGSFIYAHKEDFVLPDGKPASQVNGVDVEPGVKTNFTGFPLTVAHMYEGDTITLTYTAKPQHGSYDWSEQKATVQNTITISNSDNPSNVPGDDSATATTKDIDYTYTPLKREYVTLDGSWAYWRVTVNPDGYTLNGGSPLTLADTFDDKVAGDAEQSIDYASVVVSNSSVTYDYSGSTGTFVIPDSTPVTITYRTRITAQPGEAKTFRGTAVLKTGAYGDEIARATAGVTEEPVVIYPSASDVDGSGNYMVQLFVYAENMMQTGIPGATFILLDANQRPLEYKLGDNKGQPVTFTTGSDGYVNIELHEEEGDVSIEKNTGYYLEMMQAVPGYQKDNTLYSFMITDDPAYSTGGFYKYYNGDTMKVRLYPATAGLSVSIRFSGSYTLREDQQNAVTAILQKKDNNNNWVEVERHPYTDTQWGSITFNEVLYDESLGVFQNIYRVVEEKQSPWDLPVEINLTTTYYSMVNTEASNPAAEPQEFSVHNADDSVSVVIDNRYEDPQLTIIKMDKITGKTLAGAVFSVYKIVNGGAVGVAVTSYTTNASGELVIRGGGSYESETLYGITETEAPAGYLLPLNAEWHYFYFCNDPYLEPGILANLPAGATAINLTSNGDRITVDNQKEIITVPVMKLWQGTQWPDNPDVVIGLYRSVAGGDAEPVLNTDDTPRQVTLNSGMPYNNTAFKNLPSRDEQGHNITYSIKEESINDDDPLDAGYNQEYGISSAGVYIVRNKPATTLTISKEWYDFQGNKVEDESVLGEQSPVTFDVYRYVDSTPKDIDHFAGATNTDMTAFVSKLTKVREGLSFGAEDDWGMSIRDLDRQDNLGNLYLYYILETVPSFGNELYEVDEAAGTVKIKNKIAPEVVKLTVTKAELVDDPRLESLERDFEFTLKLQVDDTHPIRNWKVYTDTETPENNLVTDWNGEVKFKLKPTNPNAQTTEGASITLSLPVGVTASVTETYNPEYTVATDATVEGTKGDNGRTFSYETNIGNASATLTYTNTLHVICKVVKADATLPDEQRQVPFESLKSALKYIRDNPNDFTSTWTIYMLEDYTIPVTDIVSVGEEESLILTTASTTDPLFPFKGGQETDRAVITRGGVGGSMLKNAGTLTLENIVLDGAKDSCTAAGDGGLVNSTGILNLNDKATLRNSAASGRGGAVYAEGTVNIIPGVAITGNSAPSASALYLSGILNMTGGRITENTGAADGAVRAESTSDVINLSGSPVIFDNKNNKDKQANLFIYADSDNIVNVVTPGLAADAHIGVTAMDGHMDIGEQFATAEYEQTDNLGRFVNDAYGYRGKLKDGTSTNIVWDGLTIEIRKIVEPVGANLNDSFTITLLSQSIVMSTYIIDGTLDYSVSPARTDRPGRIILNNVKNGDDISISPLAVGDYTITESDSNYAPDYTFVETGSSEEPVPIEDSFHAENSSTITVTNTRRLAAVKLTKTLDDRLKTAEETQEFSFTVKLTEADGTAVSDFTLADGIETNANGEASFTMSPKDGKDNFDVRNFRAPVGVTMTITETVNENYRITASALTMPKTGERTEIPDAETEHDNIFTFTVTDDGADVTFANVRKMAEIELRKNLTGKVSATESFTYTVTLTRADNTPAAKYVMYREDEHPENNIVTDDNGKAAIIFNIGRDESTKAVTLTIPEGTKLVVAETEVKKTVGTAEQAIYTTKYSVNGAAEETGLIATMNKVSDDDHSIVFNNTRKTRTITVTNTVKGYSGNVVPFTYTATVTDGGENQDDYDLNDFTDGMMTFELTTGQSRALTVPYGATLTVTEGFIVGYETTVKRGNKDLGTTRTTEFQVADNLTVAFTNNQLIGLKLVNNTSSTLENVQVYVGYGTRMYRVNDAGDDQVLVPQTSARWATLESIEAGNTAQLEIMHKTGATDEQDYTVKGMTPKVGYYYTIHNEPSFHETANPAILRVYDAASYEVKGKLRYSVQDSTVTFTEQPLVSFDSNGGAWTTEMDGYHDRDGDRRVYQKAVDSGEAVERPTPDPVYPTAEEIGFLGWTADEAFAKKGHTAGEDISAKAYDFDTEVTAPITLYAVWAKPARDERVVTVKNGHTESLNVTATLTQNGAAEVGYTVVDGQATDTDGKVSFTLAAGESKNLTVPDGVKLVLSLETASLAVSSEYTLTASTDNKSFTIDKVERDGTVTFIPGICKITDSEEGNVLYDSNGNPAVYGKLSDAFTAYGGTLYTDTTHTTVAAQAAVKMLVDEYTIQQSAALTFPNKTMTLTTAGKTDADFPYMGERDRSTIYRASNGVDNSCFVFADKKPGTVTLTDIILDGGSERGVKVNDGKNGALINVTVAGATVNISTGATLRNVEYKAYTSNANGGAVYMTNGTLNVSAGLFSNLYARQGGAICVTGGNLNVTGTAGSTQFEDCRSERQDGGAIYYSREQDLLIDGGEDKDHPGILFTRCVAAFTTGTGDGSDGGAIFATSNYKNTVTVKGCSFIECSARTGNGSSTAGYGGGGICAYHVKGLTVEACSFESCDTLCGGGAVAAMVRYTETIDNETVTIANCSFNQCNCKGQAGALGVYQDDNNKANSATKLSIIDSSFNNCSSGTNNGSGGAIQCYLPCMVFTDSSFTDCWAGKEGGAVNNFFGAKYYTIWGKSSMTMTRCRFIRCRAEDRYQAEQMPHYGGGINTKAKTVTVTDSYFEDCVSTLREGGALHLGGQDSGSKATITGSTFKNCMAKTGGGAVMASTETLEVSDSFFYGCQAFGVPESYYKYDNANKKNQNGGGAIAHSENSRGTSTQNKTIITNCVFSADSEGGEGAQSCSTFTDGGAIWTRAKEVEINNCTMDGCTANNNGGGIYLSKNETQNAAISGIKEGETIKGSITNCRAVNGSAVYVEDKATFSGDLSVSGNTVSTLKGGAIQTVDAGKLYFEGDVVVKDNTCSADSAYKHDVLMQIDGNTIINTTSIGLGSGANIGVYVPGVDGDNFYGKHGQYSQPFGTYHNSDAGSNFLDAFFNDRDSELYGYQGTENDHPIRWGFYVCKITDAGGNTLKRTNGRDAVYQQLSQAFDEFTSVKTESGEENKAVYIKMLVENYAIRQDTAITNFPAADITLTTASSSDASHPYRGTEGTFSTIYRTNSENPNPLFNVNTSDAIFQLRDITLDGRRNDKTATEGAYKLITATAGEIVVNSGTTLQYAKGDKGAAIDGVTVTINGSYDKEKKEPTVKITNCTATLSGGAISTQNLTITNTSTVAGEYGTVFTNCTSGTETESGKGGAIYAAGTAVSMTGASFTDCHSTGDGGVLFHNHTGTDSATEITKCAFTNREAIVGAGGAGGAVSSNAATLTVNGSSFNTVKAAGNGGAISHTGATGTTITDTTFTDCLTTDPTVGFGGSVYSAAKAVTLNGGEFKNSTSANHGGALYCQSSVDGSAVIVSGTSFENCSSNLREGAGGAIYSRTRALTLQDYTPEGGTTKTTTIHACMALAYSGAVHMEAETDGSTLNIEGGTVISGCYANKGGAIYLKSGAKMNLSGSPEFTQNGYRTVGGSIENAAEGACIYLEEGSKIYLSGSPKFSRNILPNEPRVTNGGITDFMRQDIFMAGYASTAAYDTNAASIWVDGELTGDTIWVWPEKSPHIQPNEQFAKIVRGKTVSDDSLSKFRNALADSVTGCNHGEYLAGVQVGTYPNNVFWDKMYTLSFRKKDNKGVDVPDAVFTLFKDLACSIPVATAVSADGEDDTDAQGKLLARGTVEFAGIRIGAYYMKETRIPTSFKENNATYLVLVGSPYLSPTDVSRPLWEGDGPLTAEDAATLVARFTTDAGKYYGIFPLGENNKAVLRANIGSANVGIINERNDYQAAFMKVDSEKKALPGAAFTIYTAILGSDGQPQTFDDGYPKLVRWSRDGETYPVPVLSADGTDTYKDKDNKTLPKGMVYFRELPLGTYYLLETYYPERNGESRRTYYLESDRVFRLTIEENESTKVITVRLSEWKPTPDNPENYDELEKVEVNYPDREAQEYYAVANQEVVCKLTDDSDNLLYTQGHEVWENKTESSFRRFPAIYPTLEEGFDAAGKGSFVYNNGAAADVSNAIKLKVLKDFTLGKPILYNSTRSITFTTAENRVAKDRYIFSTTSTDPSNLSRARIWRGYNDTSHDANDGALITLATGTDMTLQNIRLIGQKGSYNGRAIHVAGDESSLTILINTQIEDFKQEAEEGSAGIDVKGGAILLDDNTSLTINGGYNRTAIFKNNTVANSRPAGSTDGDGKGNTGADGGAIAVGADCTVSITNAQFIGNQATAAAEKRGNGGAISINRTKNAAGMMDLPISNVVFSGNSASYQGGALRVAENCSLTVENCTFSNNRANTFTGQTNAPGEGGAIAVLSKQDNPSTLTINGGSFTGNSAAGSKGGAVKIGGFGTLTLTGGVTMSGNSAVNGGAVTVAPGANVTFTSGTISGNKASSGNGGAFYVEGTPETTTVNSETGQEETTPEARGVLTISGGSVTGNTATANGGAVYAANYAVVTISGGSVTGNAAILGSAIYAENGVDAEHTTNVTVTNASITGNTASGTDGGAINVEGPNARLYFGGTPTVFDNFGALGKNQQMNLVLSEDYNNVINTTTDGLSDGVIGVFVIESNNTVFENHGLPGKPFGTFGLNEKGEPVRRNPQVFRSDHALSLYGVTSDEVKDNTGENLIYWVDVICKLTDADDKILYQDINLTINGKKEARKAQAVYARITDYDGPNDMNNGFNALRDGFDAAQGTLYSRNGASYTDYPYTTGTAVKLKMLKDYDLDKSIRYEGSRMVTFTTAELQANVTEEMKGWGDYFWFKTDRTGADGKAWIQRDLTNSTSNDRWRNSLIAVPMITDTGTALTLTDITLDGSKSTYTSNADGAIVNVASGSVLTVASGATLQNAETTGNGGALYVSTRASATFSGGTINGNMAARGAGIYLAWDNANNHAILNLTGEPSFGGTDRVTQDELNNGTVTGKAVDDLKGTEGNFVRKDSNDSSFKTEDKEPTNGSKTYPKNGAGYYLVRQDIYIHDIATPHNAIRVTGEITSGDGTIWVWANNADHYEMLKQFAVFYGNGINLSPAEKESSIRAFRDAQPDSLTNCGGDYLTGQRGEAINNWECIYWTGGFDVVFLKTDAFGGWKTDASGNKISEGLPDAVFTLYTDEACATPYVMTFTDGTGQTTKSASSKSSDGTATYKDKNGNTVTLLKGEVLLSKVSPRIFYLKETTPPSGYNRDENKTTVYQVEVSGTGGLTMRKKDASGEYKVEVFKEKRREVTVNGVTTDLIQYVVMNTPEAERKVILRKVNDKHGAVPGASFEILRYDRSPVSGTDVNGTVTTTFTSGASGVFFVGNLPYGTYYLHETVVPDAYNKLATNDNWFILTVNENGYGYKQADQTIIQELKAETTAP